MPLKTNVKNIDDVPEAFRDMYVEQPDKTWELELEEEEGKKSTLRSLRMALNSGKQTVISQRGEITKLKEKIAGLPDDFNPDQFTALQEKLVEMEAALVSGGGDEKDKKKNDDVVASTKTLYEQKLVAQAKKNDTIVATLSKKLEDEKAITRKLLVDETLHKALVENGVDRQFLKATSIMLAGSAIVDEDDGQRTAKIKTADGEKVDLAKYVADWASSDEGKPFLTPAKGGGAEGGSSNKKESDDNPWKAGPTFNLTRQGQIFASDRAKAERLAKAAGKVLPAAATS